MRCDANVSIRKSEATELGERTEIKNINSYSQNNQSNFYNATDEKVNNEDQDNNSFDLIETFAYEILNSLRKYNNISKATVTIHKPNSPLKELVEDISVTASEEF